MKREEEEEYLGPDRLSSLPDALLIHIFSFLDTKQAIQACFSLKKWVNLWTFLPDLDFTTSVFKNLSSFDKFVDKVLNLRDDSIVKISNLTYDRSLVPSGSKHTQIAKSTLERMFSFIVSHEVKHLTLFGQQPIPLHPLGSCAALTSLKLGPLALDRTLCLNLVVTLYLKGALLTKQETFSGCPNLKNLTLINSFSGYGYYSSCDHINVIAPQLSMLTINHSSAAEVMLSTPRLTALKIRTGASISLLQSGDLDVLDTVDVIVDTLWGKNLQQFSNLISMLKCFHNAKSVTLSHNLIKLLSMFPHELEREPSPFCNVKLLNIAPPKRKSCTASSLALPDHVMTYLLRNSPKANIVAEFTRGLV